MLHVLGREPGQPASAKAPLSVHDRLEGGGRDRGLAQRERPASGAPGGAREGGGQGRGAGPEPGGGGAQHLPG